MAAPCSQKNGGKEKPAQGWIPGWDGEGEVGGLGGLRKHHPINAEPIWQASCCGTSPFLKGAVCFVALAFSELDSGLFARRPE